MKRIDDLLTWWVWYLFLFVTGISAGLYRAEHDSRTSWNLLFMLLGAAVVFAVRKVFIRHKKEQDAFGTRGPSSSFDWFCRGLGYFLLSLLILVSFALTFRDFATGPVESVEPVSKTVLAFDRIVKTRIMRSEDRELIEGVSPEHHRNIAKVLRVSPEKIRAIANRANWVPNEDLRYVGP